MPTSPLRRRTRTSIPNVSGNERLINLAESGVSIDYWHADMSALRR